MTFNCYDRLKFRLGSHRTLNCLAITALQVASWAVILLKRTENYRWPHVISDPDRMLRSHVDGIVNKMGSGRRNTHTLSRRTQRTELTYMEGLEILVATECSMDTLGLVLSEKEKQRTYTNVVGLVDMHTHMPIGTSTHTHTRTIICASLLVADKIAPNHFH